MKRKRAPGAGQGRKKKRGPGPVAAIVLAAAVCCWTGLVRVDRQIRAVTINQSPPLWESREEGDLVQVTVLGHRMAADLGPARRAGEAIGAQLEEVAQTPSAPVRVLLAVRSLAERPPAGTDN